MKQIRLGEFAMWALVVALVFSFAVLGRSIYRSATKCEYPIFVEAHTVLHRETVLIKSGAITVIHQGGGEVVDGVAVGSVVWTGGAYTRLLDSAADMKKMLCIGDDK